MRIIDNSEPQLTTYHILFFFSTLLDACVNNYFLVQNIIVHFHPNFPLPYPYPSTFTPYLVT